MDVKEAIKQEIADTRQKLAALEKAYAVLGGAVNAAQAKKTTKPVKRNYPAHCLAPNCKKEHKGPRFRFLCAEHFKRIGKAQAAKLGDAWRKANGISSR